jgi:hypothetical protein
MAKPKRKPRAAITKSGFVRSLPNATPAREVVAKAKERGLVLTEKLVYAIRSDDRARAAIGSKAAVPATPKAQVSSPRARGAAEELLLAVASKVGLTRAIELLLAEDRRVIAALAAR